ncbi:MAG: hypothetical protein ABIP97_10830, partial [Chthoniobacterales bacterium]
PLTPEEIQQARTNAQTQLNTQQISARRDLSAQVLSGAFLSDKDVRKYNQQHGDILDEADLQSVAQLAATKSLPPDSQAITGLRTAIANYQPAGDAMQSQKNALDRQMSAIPMTASTRKYLQGELDDSAKAAGNMQGKLFQGIDDLVATGAFGKPDDQKAFFDADDLKVSFANWAQDHPQASRKDIQTWFDEAISPVMDRSKTQQFISRNGY